MAERSGRATKDRRSADGVAWDDVPSPVGTLRLVASPKGLRSLSMSPRGAPPPAAARDPPALAPYRAALERFFAGDARALDDLPLDVVEGTPFQRRVWAALRRIPYGETRSYAELAAMAGHPRAVRAVGQANGANPVGIVVPCHRVIAADGTIGGYAGGLERKRKLLELEREVAKEAKGAKALVAAAR